MPKNYGFKPSGGTGGEVDVKDKLPKLPGARETTDGRLPTRLLMSKSSLASAALDSEKPAQAPRHKTAKPKTVHKPPAKRPGNKQPIARETIEPDKARIALAVSAVLRLALEGETLPLDVAWTLVNSKTQSEVVGRVQGTVLTMEQEGEQVDLMQVGETLSGLGETVVGMLQNTSDDRVS